MASSRPHGLRPTRRQAEYLAFIQAFTDRWKVPPSFEEIARHFSTTSPAVNGMVKTLEARGFLVRLPGRARTLRVVVPRERLEQPEPRASKPAAPDHAGEVQAVGRMACMVVERLVPALKEVDTDHLYRALDAVRDALETACLAAGASAAERKQVHDALLRAAMIAQGDSPETRPGRRLPGWRRPR